MGKFKVGDVIIPTKEMLGRTTSVILDITIDEYVLFIGKERTIAFDKEWVEYSFRLLTPLEELL